MISLGVISEDQTRQQNPQDFLGAFQVREILGWQEAFQVNQPLLNQSFRVSFQKN